MIRDYGFHSLQRVKIFISNDIIEYSNLKIRLRIPYASWVFCVPPEIKKITTPTKHIPFVSK